MTSDFSAASGHPRLEADASVSVESDRGTGPAARRRARRSSRPRIEDAAARAARGIADGYSEASQAFAEELEGSTGLTDLVNRSLAGSVRANARFLEELASVMRQLSDDMVDRPRAASVDEIDYEYLADLVAMRLRAGYPVTEAPAPSSPADPLLGPSA
jgi:hypothetical protein